ncbi:MAG TPA: hypothetical protein VHL59_02375, partial [Thermoanaerobaculia bacterium]|nr:hypothetical protein [Thermoanaerobaculia bacterium]
GVWREGTLEPLVIPIALDQRGVVRRSVGFLRFHTSRYHPGFHISLSAPTDDRWWREGDRSLEIWSHDPPHVEIEVRSSDGATILRESGPISEANGWIVTGGGRPGETEVAIYKLVEFTGSPFSTYDVLVRVVKSTSSRSAKSVTFYISAIKSYALLPNALATLLLVATFAVSTPIVMMVRYLRRRGRRSVVAGA